MTFTKEQLTRIIESADEVITALAGTNEDLHPSNSKGMVEAWDHLNDVTAPPAKVKKLAEMALAGMEAEPVAWSAKDAMNGERFVFGLINDVNAALSENQYLEITPLYSAPQPLTTSERAELENYRKASAIEINDEMVFAFCRAISDDSVGTDEVEDIKTGLRAAFANVAAPQLLTDAETEFFSYGSEHGFEYHKTAQGAIDAAEAAIDDYRGDACDGWSDEVDSVCWGVVLQQAEQTGLRPRTEEDRCDPQIEQICNYVLMPELKMVGSS